MNAPWPIRLVAGWLTVQTGALLFIGVLTIASPVASSVASSGCIVSTVLGGLGGLIGLIILWPICGFLAVTAHQLNGMEAWARVTTHVLYGIEGAIGLALVLRGFPTGALSIAQTAIVLVLMWLPVSRKAFALKAAERSVADPIASGIAQALVFTQPAPAFSQRSEKSSLPASAWAGVWVALVRDPWARWISAAAVVLGLAVAWTTVPPPRLALDGLPDRPSHSFIASRPEASLEAPGAVAYQTQIDGAGCGGQADAYVDSSSPQAAAAVFAWYDHWLTAHRWKRQAPTVYEQEISSNGYPAATYKRGARETYSIEFSAVGSPPYHGGASGATVPGGAKSVYETSYVIAVL